LAEKPPIEDEEPNDLVEDLPVGRPLHSNNLMSIGTLIKWGLVVAVPIAAIYGLLNWVSSGVNLLSRSMGAANAVSNSLEPYELVFRSAIKETGSISVGDRPYEWRLSLPRAYVVNETGSQFGISGDHSGNNGADNFYGVFIDAKFNSTTQEARPAVLKQGANQQETYLGFSMSNGYAMAEILRDGDCLQADDLWKKIESNGGSKGPAAKQCSLTTVNCQIYTNYHGWNVKLFVPRQSTFSMEPLKACAAAKSFLDKHTTHVDYLN
jgi:hypothetical protein